MPLLGAGDIIDRSAQFYRTHAGTVLRIIGWNLAMGAVAAAADAILVWLWPDGSPTATAVSVVVAIPAAAISLLTMILLVRAVAIAVRGPERTPPVTWRDAWRSFWPVAGAFAGTAAILFLGFAAFIVPGIVFWGWFAFAPVLVALGLAPWKKSFAVSRELSAGRLVPTLWRLLAPAVFFSLFQLVAVLVLVLVSQGASRGIWSIELAAAGAPLWFLVAVSVATDLVRGLVAPLYAIALTLLCLSLLEEAKPVSHNA